MLDKWFPVKLKLPKKIAKLGIGKVDESTAIIFGGIYGNEDNEYCYLNEVHRINFSKLTITTLSPMKEKRILYPVIPKHENSFYILGGQFNTKCERYDFLENKWTDIASYGEFLPDNDLQTFSIFNHP